jgi:hypothetical protein
MRPRIGGPSLRPGTEFTEGPAQRETAKEEVHGGVVMPTGLIWHCLSGEPCLGRRAQADSLSDAPLHLPGARGEFHRAGCPLSRTQAEAQGALA